MAKVFFDTNVIVYATDAGAGAKQDRALDLIRAHLTASEATVSTQVCVEYASVALTKLGRPLPVVERELALFERMEIVVVEPLLIRAALRLMSAYSLSYWDALIVASAQAAHCAVLLTEDLSDGQLYGPVRAVNPFA